MIPMMVLSGAMFSFEKLNRAVGSFDRVPIIAEFMPTKWGYEALVVLQFKDNEFQRHFYQLEKEERNANYKTVYLLPELQKRLDYCIDNWNKRDSVEVATKMRDALGVLHRSLQHEHSVDEPEIPFEYIPALNYDSVTEEALYETVGYIEQLQEKYAKIFGEKNKQRDAIVSHLMTTDPQLYEAKRAAYHNESVADLAQKVFEKNKILQFKDQLVQQYDPIYRDPIPTSAFDIGAHFLAPRKHFLGHYFDTFWFDLAILWLMCIALYFSLHLELLRRIGNLFAILRRGFRK